MVVDDLFIDCAWGCDTQRIPAFHIVPNLSYVKDEGVGQLGLSDSNALSRTHSHS